jgi:hypothetical protein
VPGRGRSSAARPFLAKSTGPRTEEGKAKVSRNALKHGLLAEPALLPDEDEAIYREFRRALLEDLQPLGALESSLAEKIVNETWRLRRYDRIEAGLFIREEATAQEEHYRKIERAQALTQSQIDLRLILMKMGKAPPDEVVTVINEELHWLARCLADDAREKKMEGLGLMGESFSRDASGPDAFSKLGRYETAAVNRLRRLLEEFRTLQDRPKAAAPTGPDDGERT